MNPRNIKIYTSTETKSLAIGPSIVVISDLHIGAGSLDDFDAGVELEFVSFLGELSRRLAPIHLVINGDFLEFVQAEHWEGPDLRSATADGQRLCFTETQSLSKLRSIVRHHPNVFDALGRFLAGNKTHKLTILPGNHDADLFWNGVREELFSIVERAAQCSIDGRFAFFLSQVFHPSESPSIWIEHGHQHDDCNKFFVGSRSRWDEMYPPYLAATTGELRLIECVGTRFLLKFLNRLDATYPFVDNVKPFSKFIKMFGASAIHAAYGPVPASVAIWNMLRFLATTTKSSPKDLLTVADGTQSPITELVRRGWSRMSNDQRDAVTAAFRNRGIRLDSPVEFLLSNNRSAERFIETLGEHLDIAEMFPDQGSRKLSAAGSGKLKLIPGFFADESADLVVAARNAIEHSGATAVVMGHTHEPKDHPDGLNYVNTGSWTRYFQSDKTNEPSSWELLRRSAASHFPFRLLFAEIAINDPAAVTLNVWRSSKCQPA